jgi:hypothetical protein
MEGNAQKGEKMNEQWEEIKGTDGRYYVSNTGKVKSCKGDKEIMLKQQKDKDGYLQVNIYYNHKQITQKVHRLVGYAFIDNPLNLPQINHKDENKANNNVDNLEWCDCKYNINYGGHTQRVANTQRGRKHTQEHIEKIRANAPNSRKVVMMNRKGEELLEFRSASEAGRYLNGNATNVTAVIKGRSNSYKGYVFKYA